jgi:hypothetical protein
MTAPAEFLGTQPGYLHLPPIELFNLLAPIDGYPVGSTVSRETLERRGYRIDFQQPDPRRSRAEAIVTLLPRDEFPARAA